MSKRLKYIFLTLTAAIVLAAVSSCSSGKKAVVPSSQQGVEYGSIYKKMVADYGDWQSVRIPVTLRLSSPKNLNIGGNATMVRGKSLTIALRFFGMEIGQLYVSHDSIVVIDKVNRQYMVQPVGDILAGFDVNVSNLQDLLTGRAFILGDEGLTDGMERDFFITDEGGNVVMKPKRQPYGAEYSFCVDGSGAVSLLTVVAGMHDPVTCSYAEPQITEEGQMAGEATIQATLKDRPLSLVFDWNLAKARWNNAQDLKVLSIPSGYTRRTAAEMLKSAQKAL